MLPEPEPTLNIPEADSWCKRLQTIAAALTDLELPSLAYVCWKLSAEIELTAHPPGGEDA